MPPPAPQPPRHTRKFKLDWADFDIEPHSGVVEGPTWDDVRSLVEHLAGCAEGFIILSVSELTYVQAARVAEGLMVEHQQGDTDHHYALEENPVDSERAVEIFRAFFDDPSSIDEHGEWNPMEI